MTRQRRVWLIVVGSVFALAAISYGVYWAQALRYEQSTTMPT